MFLWFLYAVTLQLMNIHKYLYRSRQQKTYAVTIYQNSQSKRYVLNIGNDINY